MKRLIVNADDFGFTRGVNAGIVTAFREGILTSTSIMANGEAFEDAVELARANPGLGVGCHLTLVGGRGVAPGSQSLADRNGMLPKTVGELLFKLASGAVRISSIESEFHAQVERVRAAGISPTHLDTHKHTHLHPQVLEALARVARDYGIRWVRNAFETFPDRVGGRATRPRKWAYWKQRAACVAILPRARGFRRVVGIHGLQMPDRFYGIALTGLLDRSALLSLLQVVEEGTGELMCHPGLYDEELERAPTRLKQQRAVELEALTDPGVRRAVDEQGIQLVSYRDLA